MRTRTEIFAIWFTALCGTAIAQQAPPRASPGTLVPPRFTPITVDEPRTIPISAAAPLESPPFDWQPPGSEDRGVLPPRNKPPVSVRRSSAEQAVQSPVAGRSLRLAPRSQTAHRSGKVTSKPKAIAPANAIGTVAGSLGVVLGLFLLIAWCTRRLAPSGTSVLSKEVVELLGRAPLTARQQMQLVRVGNKLLLVVLSPAGAETLTEITEPGEVEHLVGLCRHGQAGSSSAAFRDALAQFASEPTQRGFVEPVRAAARGAR